ncbi:MAG: hypothetical protein GY811_22410 [Myxococcales bacterium]|nr:hypothetical protein [Myxococcales bacterium]
MSETEPTVLTCDEFYRNGTSKRWLLIKNCYLDLDLAMEDRPIQDVWVPALPVKAEASLKVRLLMRLTDSELAKAMRLASAIENDKQDDEYFGGQVPEEDQALRAKHRKQSEAGLAQIDAIQPRYANVEIQGWAARDINDISLWGGFQEDWIDRENLVVIDKGAKPASWYHFLLCAGGVMVLFLAWREKRRVYKGPVESMRDDIGYDEAEPSA